jgi:hypothetical protein
MQGWRFRRFLVRRIGKNLIHGSIKVLKRKAEQSSQQLQREAQEIELETVRRAKFPADIIEQVGKGIAGGDILQRVLGPAGQTCGTIFWELKRTKAWSDSWVNLLGTVNGRRVKFRLDLIHAGGIYFFAHFCTLKVCLERFMDICAIIDEIEYEGLLLERVDDCETSPLSAPEIELLEIIRRAVYALPLTSLTSAGFPVRELSRLDLDVLQATLSAVAKHRLNTDRCFDFQDDRQRIYLASRSLSNWPQNFVSLLNDYGGTLTVESREKAVSECKKIYRNVFSKKTIEGGMAGEFMLQVIVEFGALRWNYSDLYDFQRFRFSLPTGSVHPCESIRDTYRKIQLSQAEQADRGRGSLANGFVGEHQAARRFGMPITLVRLLASSGSIEPVERAGTEVKFAEVRLNEYEERLNRIADEADRSSAVQTISLRAALNWPWDSDRTKAALLDAVLAKHVRMSGGAAESLGDLQVRLSDFLTFVGGFRAEESQNLLHAREASLALECDRCSIPGLLRSGYLQGTLGPTAPSVDKVSLEGFKAEYVFLGKLAKGLRTNTERLVKCCSELFIQVRWPRSGNTRSCNKGRVQPFIKRNDVPALAERLKEIHVLEGRERTYREEIAFPVRVIAEDVAMGSVA